VDERPGGEELVAAFTRWAADERSAAAAANRSRTRSLQEQAASSATWAGILLDLAEQGTPVSVVVAGRRRSGRIACVGRDFCVIDSGPGQTALIRVAAMEELRPDSDSVAGAPAGDRESALDLSLVTVLSLLAEDRSSVGLVTSAGLETTGHLIAAGEDVLTVRTDPPTRRLVYVPLGAVAVCELR
jgi:hypothetical protein